MKKATSSFSEFLKRFLYHVKSNRQGYKIGRKLLNSKILTSNPVYKNIYTKQIENKITELESNAPKEVDIGTTNFCNANCIMCPHNKLKKMGTMNMRLYKKIIDDCSDMGVKSVCLSFFGEPFLDKDIIKKIKYAKEKELKVVFYSNASLMDKEKAKEIIEAGLDSIIISCDGFYKETYEKIRRNLNFDVVKKNIENLVKLKKDLKSYKPRIGLVFVEIDQSEKEIKEYYKHRKNKVDSIQRINMRN